MEGIRVRVRRSRLMTLLEVLTVRAVLYVYAKSEGGHGTLVWHGMAWHTLVGNGTSVSGAVLVVEKGVVNRGAVLSLVLVDPYPIWA